VRRVPERDVHRRRRGNPPGAVVRDQLALGPVATAEPGLGECAIRVGCAFRRVVRDAPRGSSCRASDRHNLRRSAKNRWSLGDGSRAGVLAPWRPTDAPTHRRGRRGCRLATGRRVSALALAGASAGIGASVDRLPLMLEQTVTHHARSRPARNSMAGLDGGSSLRRPALAVGREVRHRRRGVGADGCCGRGVEQGGERGVEFDADVRAGVGRRRGEGRCGQSVGPAACRRPTVAPSSTSPRPAASCSSPPRARGCYTGTRRLGDQAGARHRIVNLAERLAVLTNRPVEPNRSTEKYGSDRLDGPDVATDVVSDGGRLEARRRVREPAPRQLRQLRTLSLLNLAPYAWIVPAGSRSQVEILSPRLHEAPVIQGFRRSRERR
jgi:hypothetical protein